MSCWMATASNWWSVWGRHISTGWVTVGPHFAWFPFTRCWNLDWKLKCPSALLRGDYIGKYFWSVFLASAPGIHATEFQRLLFVVLRVENMKYLEFLEERRAGATAYWRLSIVLHCPVCLTITSSLFLDSRWRNYGSKWLINLPEALRERENSKPRCCDSRAYNLN